MNRITEKIKVLLGIVKNTFGKVTTDKKEIFFDGDEIAVETKVYDSDGNAIEDGEYTDDEKVYVIKESIVTEIRPKEEVKEEVVEEVKEETTETTNVEAATCEDEKEEKKELADKTITEEITEDVVEEIVNPDEPTVEERISALEEVVETLFNELREMKVREVEQVAKQENIIREFSAIKRSPTAESITKSTTDDKCFVETTMNKAEILRKMKNNK